MVQSNFPPEAKLYITNTVVLMKLHVSGADSICALINVIKEVLWLGFHVLPAAEKKV